MRAITVAAALLALAGSAAANGKGIPGEPRVADIGCGTYTLSAGTYYIESPNYPSKYPNNVDCEYNVVGEGGAELTFSCEAFEVHGGRRCLKDWLSVNGEKYCSRRTPPEETTATALQIEFHSDGRRRRRGYRCSIVVTSTATVAPPTDGDTLSCGEATLGRGTFTIVSTNHPGDYQNLEDCEYSLTTEQAGDTITLTCQAFDVEANRRCRWDYLAVEGEKFCGTTGPSGVTSQSTMTIEWHSDYSVVESGYSCTVEVSEPVPTEPPATVAPGTCCCGIANSAVRIVGGEETQVNELPWQGGLVNTGNSGIWCGATLISSNLVLTAAHCTAGRSAASLEVLLGEHRMQYPDGESRHSVARIINHPQYDSESFSYDFALLELAEAVDFPADNTIAPACLPTDPTETFTGVDAIVSGWGTTSSGGSQPENLMKVTVPVISNAVCSQSYPSYIDSSMICAGGAGGKDSCQGDSGGPMVSLATDRYEVIGVVSWGYGCALPGYPGVYGRVTEVLGWIYENASSSGSQFCS